MASSSRDISNAIRKVVIAGGEKELKRKGREFANQVCDYAKSISPQDRGDYIAAFGVRSRQRRGHLPTFQVYNTDPKAHLLEGGTEDTPEFAVFARTRFHFGGDK